jgi:hypothetical protein
MITSNEQWGDFTVHFMFKKSGSMPCTWSLWAHKSPFQHATLHPKLWFRKGFREKLRVNRTVNSPQNVFFLGGYGLSAVVLAKSRVCSVLC